MYRRQRSENLEASELGFKLRKREESLKGTHMKRVRERVRERVGDT